MTKKTIYSLLFLCITLQFACTESKNKQPDSQNLSEIYKGLYEAICKEKDIHRVFELQVALDSNSLESLAQLPNFRNINLPHYTQQKKLSITEFWENKKSIVSIMEDEYYAKNHTLLRKDSAYFKISFPLFTENFSIAAVKITYECGMYCSYNELAIYKFNNTEWIFHETLSGLTW